MLAIELVTRGTLEVDRARRSVQLRDPGARSLGERRARPRRGVSEFFHGLGAWVRRREPAAFVTPADHPWLRRRLDEADRSIGAPRHVLAERLRDLEVHPPRGGLRRMAELVLLSRVRTERAPGPVPARVRSTLFQTAACMSSAPREEVIARAASTLSVDPAALERSLFADHPDERRITGLDECPTPEDLAIRTNLAFVQALLFRSSRIHLTFEGNARAIVRSVKLGGRICTVTPGEADSSAALEISGPFSLFRRTLMYGRALSAVVPFPCRGDSRAWAHSSQNKRRPRPDLWDQTRKARCFRGALLPPETPGRAFRVTLVRAQMSGEFDPPHAARDGLPAFGGLSLARRRRTLQCGVARRLSGTSPCTPELAKGSGFGSQGRLHSMGSEVAE